MKHSNEFSKFMRNTVNLNQSRIETLSSRVKAIDDFLKNDDVFGAIYKETRSQGSFAHRTIIKPSKKKQEFDADIVFYLKENLDWEPKHYIEELYKRFKANGTYEEKCGRGTRCVTIDYAGEFHLDIVPCIHRENAVFNDTFHICNRKENTEERTNPQGFTDWLAEKNRETGRNNLIKVIRLLKYLRDIKQTFSCKSILLTTLIANQIGGLRDLTAPYTDLPTTLRVLVGRLNDYLKDNAHMPVVCNPVDDNENFNRHWDQAKYENFRNQIGRYTDWINDAFDEENQAESIKKWQKIFGDDFGREIITNSVKKDIAVENISNDIPIPVHAEEPKWPISGPNNLPLKVTVHDERRGSAIELAVMQREVVGASIAKNLKVRMEYLGGIAATHKLYWQIVNRGHDALRNNCGRGEIFPDTRVRWEETLYEGTHWIECFLVDKKKKICTGRSGRYFVKIR